MPTNLDKRDYGYSRPLSSNFATRAATASASLPGSHEVSVERINPFTGSVENLQSANATGAFTTAPGLGPASEDLIDRALEHLKIVAPALGFDPNETPEFVPDPHVKKMSTGDRIVNLQQQYRGIPVFQMERTVLFDENGAIQNVTGTSVGLPPDLQSLPTVTVEQAAVAAANYISLPATRRDAWTKQEVSEPTIDPTDYQPQVLGRIGLPSQPTIIEKGPFGEAIPAYLVFFYQGPTTRLGWHFLMSMPNLDAQYAIIVEADTDEATKLSDPKSLEVLYCQQTSNNMSATPPPKVRGNVWTHNPGIKPSRDMISFPRPLVEYPIKPLPPTLPENFPFAWVDENGELTVGNSTIAVLGNSSNSLRGIRSNGTLTFDPTPDQGDEQKVLNIFYFCNFMHDFFFMLGFDEPSGNFQVVNFSGAGRSNDPVLARAHAGPVNGTANMLTLADGKRALMNMGLVGGVNRHTAFDSDVVFHEFTHGVSNRLVGGKLDALALQQPQSRAMGEGWGDYFALTIQNFDRTAAQERTVTGDWVVNDPAGIRLAPYTDNYPASFGRIGTSPYTEEHNIGEIWCATLMKINRDLGKALGDAQRGHRLGWQIVVDGMKGTPANPSFLDARDAILRALDSQRKNGKLSPDDFRKAMRAAWRAFAHFGMGPKARSVGASLFGISEDKNPPAGL